MNKPRKARGAYGNRAAKGGPGVTHRQEDDVLMRPSMRPLEERGPRTLDLIEGRSGGAQIVNVRGGDLELRYRRKQIDDTQYRAGVHVRRHMEPGGASPLHRVLEFAQTGMANESPPPNSERAHERQLRVSKELAFLQAATGRNNWMVLRAYLQDGMTCEQIDVANGWSVRRGAAALYLAAALSDIAEALTERASSRLPWATAC